MILVGFANLFGFILITEQIPQRISEQILLLTTNKYAVLLLINLLLILVGTLYGNNCRSFNSVSHIA